MNTPTRLIDEVGCDQLSSSLLRLARSEGPSAEGRKKVLAAVAAAGAVSLAGSTANAAERAGRGANALKWGLLALAAVSIPSLMLLRHSEESAALKAIPGTLKAPATEVRPAPVVPLEPSAADAPAPVALEDLPALPLEPAPGAAPAKAQQGSLAEEVAQLQKVKLALKAGSAAQAMLELNTYARRFPHPTLGSEATVLRIEALTQRGDSARAKSLAETFLATHPSSPYAARLRSLTGTR